jgi:hypothetical protein
MLDSYIRTKQEEEILKIVGLEYARAKDLKEVIAVLRKLVTQVNAITERLNEEN